MELNGLANIKMILDRAEIDDDSRKRIEAQLETMNRYMIAIGDVLHANELEVQPWHEVRDNPEKYPTLHEKMNGGSK